MTETRKRALTGDVDTYVDTSVDTAAAPLRLLLHCVDGTAPYLTPYLLENYFPLERIGNVLSLGLAVRDTCIAPVYNKEDEKLRGYAFTSDVYVDSWLKPYHRVTVPTFDVITDRSRESSAPVANNKQMFLWTSNGRTPLSPTVHRQACHSLQSSIHMPLFDFVESNKASTEKTIQAALRRTEYFSHDLLKQDGPKNGCIWMPLLCADSIDSTGFDNELNRIHQQMKEEKERVAGVALIGWQYLTDRNRRHQLLKKVSESLQRVGHPPRHLAIMNALSLQQVFEVAVETGENMQSFIGTKLVQDWALNKKVFMLPLPPTKSMTDNDAKKPKTASTSKASSKTQLSFDENGCVKLEVAIDNREARQHPWFRDSNPLMPGCTCLACQKHSRSYIYHLSCAKELLAEILIFNHNLHCMLELFQRLSPASRQERLKYIETTAALLSWNMK